MVTTKYTLGEEIEVRQLGWGPNRGIFHGVSARKGWALVEVRDGRTGGRRLVEAATRRLGKLPTGTPKIMKGSERMKWEHGCPCGSGEPPEEIYDARGIYVTAVCGQCRGRRLRGYRPEIFTGAYEADAPIEEE